MKMPQTMERPLATVDVAIFAIIDNALQVLLVRRPDCAGEPFPGCWALPGGYIDVHKDASLEACAMRKLREKTGVRSPYLEQLGSWGSAKRDPRGYTITCVYFALLNAELVTLDHSGKVEAPTWQPVDGDGVRERLAFDHATLLAAALQRLRNKVEYTSLPAFLLPESFTLSDLQSAYETVLNRAVDKSAFRTRMLAADFIEPTGEQRARVTRPALRYRLKVRTPGLFPR
ncbi:MAG: NUDIX hydrolase, partial [Betaproteobacteria bacterium]